MKIQFFKYQATGNDFVLVDNRAGKLRLTNDQIKQICDRKFGVGADGLILIEEDPDNNFNVNYFNSDGTQSLCGNGSRAAVHFASFLKLMNGKAVFSAYDGIHHAEIMNDQRIMLQMHDVKQVEHLGEDFLLDTGSPHLIRFVDNLAEYPVFDEGKALRYDERFKPRGVNVNFVEKLSDNTLFVRTYERGVEDETLSCGTGVTAAALAASFAGYKSPVRIKTKGGELAVAFKSGQSGTFQDIFLIGPAKMVFKGELEL